MEQKEQLAALQAEMAAAWKPWEGQVIDGRFPLRSYLSGSDHSAVFLTETPEASEAAIKMTPLQPGGSSEQKALTAKLSHPGLIRIFHAGQCRIDEMDCSYVVMERARESLAEKIALRARSADECRDALPPVLDALAYLQEKNVAHGRIKPANLLAVGNKFKLSSDGLGGSATPAEPGPYDAPEMAGTGATSAADVWSLGLTLFEALTQRLPTKEQIERRQLLPPEAAPAALRDIVDYSLETDPRVRWTVTDIQSRLRPILPDPPAAESETARRESTSPRRYLIPAVLAALLLLSVWAIPKMMSHRRETPVPPADSPAPSGQPEQKAPAPVPQAQNSAPQSPTARLVSSAAGPVTRASAASILTPASNQTAVQEEVLHTVLPEPSRRARQTIQGIILVGVKVQVDQSGKVTTASLAPAGPSKYFAGEAMEAARQWTFAPADDSASRRWLLHFEFRRSGTKAVPLKLNR